MHIGLISLIVLGSLLAAVAAGRVLRRLLPEGHLNADTKDTVKLATGLVATMSALLLGLLVSSAKGSYDSVRNEVIGMAAQVAFLDRVLEVYGPEAANARAKFRETIEEAIQAMWPVEATSPVKLSPDIQAGDAVFAAIQALSPQNDEQRVLKTQATNIAVSLGQLRQRLLAQSIATVSLPLLFMVICWLVIIFLSFSLLAPPNATATGALILSALSVAGAILLILELSRPFTGLIRLSGEPLRNALNQPAK